MYSFVRQIHRNKSGYTFYCMQLRGIMRIVEQCSQVLHLIKPRAMHKNIHILAQTFSVSHFNGYNIMNMLDDVQVCDNIRVECERLIHKQHSTEGLFLETLWANHSSLPGIPVIQPIHSPANTG